MQKKHQELPLELESPQSTPLATPANRPSHAVIEIHSDNDCSDDDYSDEGSEFNGHGCPDDMTDTDDDTDDVQEEKIELIPGLKDTDYRKAADCVYVELDGKYHCRVPSCHKICSSLAKLTNHALIHHTHQILCQYGNCKNPVIDGRQAFSSKGRRGTHHKVEHPLEHVMKHPEDIKATYQTYKNVQKKKTGHEDDDTATLLKQMWQKQKQVEQARVRKAKKKRKTPAPSGHLESKQTVSTASSKPQPEPKRRKRKPSAPTGDLEPMEPNKSKESKRAVSKAAPQPTPTPPKRSKRKPSTPTKNKVVAMDIDTSPMSSSESASSAFMSLPSVPDETRALLLEAVASTSAARKKPTLYIEQDHNDNGDEEHEIDHVDEEKTINVIRDLLGASVSLSAVFEDLNQREFMLSEYGNEVNVALMKVPELADKEKTRAPVLIAKIILFAKEAAKLLGVGKDVKEAIDTIKQNLRQQARS